MSQTTVRLLRSARAVLRDIPHHNCQCYGQPGHYERCVIRRAELVVARIDEQLALSREAGYEVRPELDAYEGQLGL